MTQLLNPTFFKIRVRRQWFREEKNCTMLNARVLVDRFLIQPKWMMWVRATPTSVVDLNFKPPNWLRCKKSFEAVRNWSLSPITFSISFLRVLSKMIGLNDLEESYNALLCLGMITIVDLLKWEGQNSRSIHVLAMLMMVLKQSASLTMTLRWLHDNLPGSGIKDLLQLVIALLNSSLENGVYVERGLSAILWRTSTLTWQWKAVLKVEWSAFHSSSIDKHSQSLYLMASTAGNLRLLTQFMSFQGPHFLLVISWILRSKKVCLVDLTIFLKVFQSSRVLDIL